MICTVFSEYCQEFSFSHLSIHDESLDELTTRVVNMRTPTSAGLKQMEHFGQIRGTGRFAQFDYMDKDQNKLAYGELYEEQPPLINVTNISDSVPISLFVGENDDLATKFSND